MKLFRQLTLITVSLIATARPSMAQVSSDDYDDFGEFSADPIQLDSEVREIFGRFFQTSLQLGTNIFTGGLGEAYNPGFTGGIKFVLYFDKIWATELGAAFSNHRVVYQGTGIDNKPLDFELAARLVPLNLGFRYGFNRNSLGRGVSLLNPYFSANALLIFRSEEVIGSGDTSGLDTDLISKYIPGAVITDTAFGFDFGGGMEFDVYRQTIYVGIDLRYHVAFWSDSNENFGLSSGDNELARSGNYISVKGTVTYNY